MLWVALSPSVIASQAPLLFTLSTHLCSADSMNDVQGINQEVDRRSQNTPTSQISLPSSYHLQQLHLSRLLDV